MAFSPDYVALVLNENFEDAKAQFLEPLLAIHEAHLVMLAEQGIVSPADAAALAAAVAEIDPVAVRSTPYDGTYEDLFFLVERLIARRCAPETAGRLHTARSRNDIDMTLYRMRVREHLIAIIAAVLDLRHTLLEQAARHTGTIFPAHTHTQPAQPTTLGHYLLAVVEQLERDVVRLQAALACVNRCPLGACAITGTGFSIDRARTSELLGFGGPTGNTYGSIATVDYLVEAVSAATNVVVGCGRVVQDLLLWSTVEVGYLRLSDGFVQTSSIMPQKRNPVALEHARALLSKAMGQLLAVVQTVHNTPFGDIVDTEDDLQPLVGQAFRDTRRGVALMAAAMAEATFDVARMRQRTETSWVTITELADTLARDHDVPFVSAHRLASTLIQRCTAAGDQVPVFDVFLEVIAAAGVQVEMTATDLDRILSPAHFVAVRETLGGPGERTISSALAASSGRWIDDRDRLKQVRDALAAAEASRRTAVLALRSR